ncbi:MAG: ATP-dependent RNA helicase DbpA [Sulfurimonas sp.]
MATKNFSNLPLAPSMIQNLDTIGYTQMTPIQAEALPLILEGKDLLAQAKTGSGKTAAFGIGLLHKLNVKKFRVQSLILCPTRELADQVAKELRLLAKFQHNIKVLTLCGGTAFGPQYGSLRHGAHIVVGTPGRVLKHLKKESLSLDDLETLVFDEADRMLDMGFIEEIDEVLEFVPKQRQTLLFSATYTDEVTEISQRVQNDPVFVKTITQEAANKIEESFYLCEHKLPTLLNLFAKYKPENVILFTNTKSEADIVAEELRRCEVDALALHGDLEQYERDDVLVQFINKSCRVLVATDVAARGLDIDDLSMVVNYDLPHTLETYTHRIGRTGRAGKEGLAVTLYTDNEEEKLQEYKKRGRGFYDASKLDEVDEFTMHATHATLVIEGGKKQKLRAGDILGALARDVGIDADAIGKIAIYDRQSYVAIKQDQLQKAYNGLKNTKVKAKRFSVWVL